MTPFPIGFRNMSVTSSLFFTFFNDCSTQGNVKFNNKLLWICQNTLPDEVRDLNVYIFNYETFECLQQTYYINFLRTRETNITFDNV